jgi:hypothetical protein
MIDPHSHMLPGLEDGAPDLATSQSMARASGAGAVTSVDCTQHIVAGLFAISAHHADRQPPDARRSFGVASACAVENSAWDIVETRPRGVIEGMLPRNLAGMSEGVREVIAVDPHY